MPATIPAEDALLNHLHRVFLNLPLSEHELYGILDAILERFFSACDYFLIKPQAYIRVNLEEATGSSDSELDSSEPSSFPSKSSDTGREEYSKAPQVRHKSSISSIDSYGKTVEKGMPHMRPEFIICQVDGRGSTNNDLPFLVVEVKISNADHEDNRRQITGYLDALASKTNCALWGLLVEGASVKQYVIRPKEALPDLIEPESLYDLTKQADIMALSHSLSSIAKSAANFRIYADPEDYEYRADLPSFWVRQLCKKLRDPEYGIFPTYESSWTGPVRAILKFFFPDEKDYMTIPEALFRPKLVSEPDNVRPSWKDPYGQLVSKDLTAKELNNYLVDLAVCKIGPDGKLIPRLLVELKRGDQDQSKEEAFNQLRRYMEVAYPKLSNPNDPLYGMVVFRGEVEMYCLEKQGQTRGSATTSPVWGQEPQSVKLADDAFFVEFKKVVTIINEIQIL